MPLDTRSKRASSAQLLKPYALDLPLPDGTISQGDRQHSAWAYSGILVTVILPPTVPDAPGGYATYDLDLFTHPYDGRLLNSRDLEIQREVADPLWNATPEQTVTLELDNTDGALTADYLAGIGGRVVTLNRYDVRSGDMRTRFNGKVTWPRLAEHTLQLECAVLDAALAKELVPEPVVELDTFPNAVDVGATIPVVFGNVPTMPCPNVCDDKVGSFFDYLIGHGALAVTALARNGPNDSLYSIQFSECLRAAGGAATSWAEVARTDLYPGYTVVRFVLRQQDFNNALHKIYANVTGLQPERNFAIAVQTVVNNPWWSLGQPVNAASFTAAAAVLDALPNPLYCDGALLAPRKAQDILADLLLPRGMRLRMNAAGEITLTVDQPRNTVAMAIGADPGDGPRNIAGPVRERSGPAPEERVRRLVLQYRLDLVRNEWVARARRTVNPTGKKRVIQHAFIRDPGTADAVADYLGKRIYYGQETVTVPVTQEGCALGVGDLVSFTKASMGYAGDVLEVWKIAERLTALTLTLRGYSWTQFAYTPGTLPGNPIVGAETDNSRTYPTPPTTPSLSGSGTRVAGDGHVTAWVTLSWTNPTSNFSVARVRYRATGTTPWLQPTQTATTGAVTATVEGLLPVTAYDYSIQAVNAFGNLTADSGILANQTTPTDASVPTAPAAPQVLAPKPGAMLINDLGTTPPPLDWASTVLYRALTNNSAASAEIQRGKTGVFGDDTVAYNTQYWYFLKYLDTSGNLSAFSPSGTSGVGGAPQTNSPDIGLGQVGSSNIGTGQVDTGHVVGGAISAAASAYVPSYTTTSGSFFDLPGGAVTFTVTAPTSDVRITVWGNPLMINTGGSPTAVGLDFYLYRDGSGGSGTLLQQGTLLDPSVPGGGDFFMSPLILDYMDTGISGTHTYIVSLDMTSTFGTQQLNLFDLKIQVQEFKR